MLVLNFLCKKYIHFYHASLQQAFQLFQSSFFQVKRINHCEGHVIFKDIEHQLEENILYHFLHYSFLIISSLSLEASFIQPKIIY